ncbi:MAG TPA: heparan-alpha-glucosaminide N-acetyltransferase domain-containing protein [Candidatus Hydrogenedentes bacterium]|nr:heparan-alpha-glucosaminide N-acetyltransferase domain-containing protein [Candidatus Hydrogenedentota bacterium]
MSKTLTSTARIEGIDQTRGYAILGMIVVNYASIFTVFPEWMKHHKTGMTYADTIAPLFIFVVGMTFRLSFQRRSREGGHSAARSAAVERNLKLLGIGLLYGHFDLEVSVWDALTDIALASLIALPVIHRSSLTRLITAVLLLAAYQVVFMVTGYGEWVMAHTINGGPLGPLSWAFPLLAGTIAMDWIEEIRATGSMRRPLIKMAAAGFLLMAAGQLLSLEWPGIKTAWPHTQYGMTAPYPVFSSGLSLITVAFFVLLSDGIRFKLPHLTTLGSNPLVLYLMQAGLNQIASDWLDSDLTLVPALTGMAAVYFACYCTAWILRRKGIYIKL